jgi:hypothetical protein
MLLCHVKLSGGSEARECRVLARSRRGAESRWEAGVDGVRGVCDAGRGVARGQRSVEECNGRRRRLDLGEVMRSGRVLKLALLARGDVR